MIITNEYSRYQLDANQFYSLFTENVSDETFEALSNSAANGNLDSIDMLHNLALRHDNIGEKSEEILFDLFSGKTPGKTGIDRDIQLASLKLYETACNAKEKNNEDMRKLYTPSKLLYMAGSAITNTTESKEVASFFSRNMIAQTQYEHPESLDLWGGNRMLGTDEINAAMCHIIKDVDNLSLNFPTGLVNPISNVNMLSDLISNKKPDADYLNKPEIFPVNTGEHWVLFILHKDKSDGEIHVVVFGTNKELEPDIKETLTDAAKVALVPKDENIVFINKEMQKNVPNGCGVFIVKAVDLLSHTPDDSPITTLKAFTENFSELTAEEQTLFNIQSRRQIYGYSIL